MSEGSGNLPTPAGPSGDADLPDVDLLAAALRADAQDVDTYARVVLSTLAQALPPGVVEVERERSLGNRLSGQPGRVRALRIRLGETGLALSGARHGLRAQVSREVRGIAISNKEVDLAEWTRVLASELRRYAADSEAARVALGRLLGAE